MAAKRMRRGGRSGSPCKRPLVRFRADEWERLVVDSLHRIRAAGIRQISVLD